MTQSRRFAYRSLDHWRGFAALWVTMFHSFGVWIEAHPKLLPGTLHTFLMSGWLGVHIFFVISGYCIAARLSEDYGRNSGPFEFVADRLWRIFPTYWAALLFSAGVSLAGTVFNQQPIFGTATAPGALPGTASDAAAAFLAVEPWLGKGCYLLVAWTLSFEIGFYLMAACLFQVARALEAPLFGFGLGIALALWAAIAPPGVSPGPLGLWHHFTVGVVAWLLINSRSSSVSRAVWVTFLGAAIILMLSVSDRLRSGLLVAILTGYLMVILYPFDNQISKLPFLRWLAWSGTISYSLYLIHVPVAGKLRNLLSRFTSEGDWRFVWVPIAGALAAILAAAIFHRFVEAPIETARKRFRLRLQKTYL